VQFRVRDKVRLPVGTTASVRWRNLIGQRYLYLHPGPGSTVLTNGAHLDRTTSVVDLGELFNRLGPIVKAIDPNQVNTFVDAVASALDGNQAKLSQALDDLATVTTVLAARDAAIGRLVTDLDTVSGTIAARDAEIRTVLDNLVALVGTLSQHTDVLDTAVTDLGDLSVNLDALLAQNRPQIDRILANLTTLVHLVESKLPALDDTLAHLGPAATALFGASRYGEWRNDTIPCGQVGRTPEGAPLVTVPCVPQLSPPSGAMTAPAAAAVPGAAGAGAAPAVPPAAGAAAVAQLLGVPPPPTAAAGG
jgi:phospholipid/cholesterol/gamma-HCH transport system substrate-binding protein